MQSRMERYQSNEKKRYERTKKNTKLYEKIYEDIYNDTTYKNMSVIDSAKQININKLKDMLDDKYDTRQYRTLKDYSIEDINLDDDPIMKESNQKTHDINKVLNDAKSKRAFIEESKEKEKYLKFLEGRNTKYDNRYDELEKEEKELEELINTMTISKRPIKESDDLFSDLKGDDNTIVTNPISADFSLPDSVIKKEKKEDIPKETGRVDKTFYTDSNMFTKNDFEDFSTISKELNKSNKFAKIIIVILVLAILIVAGYFIVTKYVIK